MIPLQKTESVTSDDFVAKLKDKLPGLLLVGFQADSFRDEPCVVIGFGRSMNRHPDLGICLPAKSSTMDFGVKVTSAAKWAEVTDALLGRAVLRVEAGVDGFTIVLGPDGSRSIRIIGLAVLLVGIMP